jgi:hypothetical protein
LINDESLSRLSYEGEIIGKDTIDIPRNTDRFIRISWAEDNPVSFRRVNAHYHWFQSKRELHQWAIENPMLIDQVDSEEFESGAIYFKQRGHAPLTRFGFEFSGNNAFYRGKIYSRNGNTKSWTDRGRFLLYRLKMPDGLLEKPRVKLSSVRDGEWLIKLETPEIVRADQLPVIQVSWYPEQLTFLAQGRQPYTLAYGNPRVLPARTDLSILLNTLSEDQIHEIEDSLARTREPELLGGLSRLQPDADAFPWSTVLLWLVLIIGVGVMVKMAVSLFKQMNRQGL